MPYPAVPHLPMSRAKFTVEFCEKHQAWSLTVDAVRFGYRGEILADRPSFCHVDFGPFDDAGDVLQRLLEEATRMVREQQMVYAEEHPELFPDA